MFVPRAIFRPSMSDLISRALEFHKQQRGKIRIRSVVDVNDKEALSIVYTPGVGAVSSRIATHPEETNEYTWRGNTVAIISDGSAVLGLGDIGPAAALPVLEGKSVIFKQFADIDAIPLVLGTKDTQAIIETIVNLSPSFGAIQLEDISAPRCFVIERALQARLTIPVMHDDQHGTAIVVLAGLINALKIVNKNLSTIRIVINGAGSAGIAIARLLHAAGSTSITMVDRKGAIYAGREELNDEKKEIAAFTNLDKRAGSLAEVAVGADVLIGVSAAGAFNLELIKSLAANPIVFALANPSPEVLPDVAEAAGVAVLATGRSDYSNQVNNALCYPGLFRGMLDAKVNQVTDEIKLRAAHAIAEAVSKPTAEKIIPSIFDPGLHELVAKSVRG